MSSPVREETIARWFTLTREIMPALAARRGWPVRHDHCFQRILLDNALGRPWREVLTAPAYRHASEAQMTRAIALGEAAVAGAQCLVQLNQRSLKLRRKAHSQPFPLAGGE